jgi:hypothetical protein
MWVMENSVRQIDGSEKSTNNMDRAAQSMWLTEFSVTYMFWSCVMLGLSNSVEYIFAIFGYVKYSLLYKLKTSWQSKRASMKMYIVFKNKKFWFKR